ncbi:unnamed protein product [Leptosia nina]|uniref:Acyltransferase 3 domain-containing protein n=1 Tax=Leptosia nina TaxID=320188 RepID=A0AAV1JNI3_9NEOP
MLKALEGIKPQPWLSVGQSHIIRMVPTFICTRGLGYMPTSNGPILHGGCRSVFRQTFTFIGRPEGKVLSQINPYLYSAQKLKHYNRTQIHRGVCISRCMGNGTDFMEAAQTCINRSIESYDLQAEVISAKWCSTAGHQEISTSSRAFGVFVVALIIITLVATVLGLFSNKMGNRFLMAFSLVKNWEILTYDRSKPRAEPRMKDLSPIEGIRVIGTQCVIFAHVILTYVYSYIDNPQFIEQMYDQFGWKMVLNSPPWLQGFFAISGFLNCYTLLILSEKRNISIGYSILSILNRYIRVTPVSVFALWFIVAWYPHMGSGPQWAWVVGRESCECSQAWLGHFLYILNYQTLGKFCMAHTWYLSADMQIHVLGTILMFILLRYRRLMLPVLGALLVASSAGAAFVVYYYELTPIITAQPPEGLRTIFFKSGIIKHLYLPVWMNLSGYICGTAAAYIHYQNQQAGVKLNEKKWFNILNQLSLHIASIVVLCGIPFLSDETPPLWVSALYSALDRSLVSICFSIFLLGLVSKCKSPPLTFLSWRGWNVLGRLSFCVFVIHFIILRFAIAYNTQIPHATLFSMISLLIVGTILTFLVSIPVCLMIEIPAIQFWKALFQGESRPPAVTEEPVNPKFDLVAGINGQQNEV